jgi:tripartite-type tricarboxylate transporter receptor subunit TctC
MAACGGAAAWPSSREGHVMKLARRTILQLGGVAVAAPALSKVTMAQAYPSRPITMIVPGAAGGPSDTNARIVAEGMRRGLGQPIIVENVSGGDGNIGTGRAARARPDGYTIVWGIMSSLVLNGAFYSLPYDVLNDFVPIVPVSKTALIMVARKTLAANDLRELIAWLKTNPNTASLALVTVGIRLLASYFQKQTGTHFALVPYRGSAPALQDLVAGQVDLLIDNPRNSLPQLRAGNIKAYAVTADTRLAVAPNIPTFAEMELPTLSYSEWFGLFAPKGTTGEIIDKLNGRGGAG